MKTLLWIFLIGMVLVVLFMVDTQESPISGSPEGGSEVGVSIAQTGRPGV